MIDIFKDTNGKWSSTRISMLLVVFSIIGIFIAHNIISMMRGTGMISLGINEVILIASVLGVKVVQNFSEKPNTNKEEEIPELKE